MKNFFYKLINGFLLKPFRLVLSYDIGRTPLIDLKQLMGGQSLSIVFDGGAYRGDFSLEVLKFFPGTRIYAFEPDSESFALLKNCCKNHIEIIPFQLALAESSRIALLYKNKSAMTNSLLENTSEALSYFSGFNDAVGMESVNTISLADFMKRESVKEIDLLKLDLQGCELSALNGLHEQILNVKAIFLEVQFVQLYKSGCLFREVDEYLQDQGFAFFQFYGLVRSPHNGRLLYGDALFLNTNYFEINSCAKK